MGKIQQRRTLEQILAGAAVVLFPDAETLPLISVASADCMGDTALHVYLWRGDGEAARLLISQGANVNAVGEMGETPLHVSVRHASSDTIALLLAAGASETLVSEFGQTALQLAEQQDRQRLYQQARQYARYLRKSNP